MRKPDNDFKEDFDSEFNNGMYATKMVGKTILMVVIVLVLLGGIFGVGYTLTIGKAQKNAEREVFKNSVAYNEQAASFLAKSYQEYNEAESDEDKEAVMEYVILRYPNFGYRLY